MLLNLGSRVPFSHFPIFERIRNSRVNFSRTLTLEMVSGSVSRRPMCPSCSKPTKICLCVRLKTPILDNSVAVTILQHSLEKKHPLNSTRIATLGLKNLNLAWVSDVNLEARFSIHLLQSFRESGPQNSEEKPCNSDPDEPAITFTIEKYGGISNLNHIWMLETYSKTADFDELYLSDVARDSLNKGFIVKKLQKRKLDERGVEFEDSVEFEMAVPAGSVLLFPSERSVGVEEIDFEVKNLIVLDGTWAKAKRMYSENPWLKMLPHLRLDIGKVSLYSEVRHQPKAGCLSSIDSIVYALKALGENPDALDSLLDVFESMVGDQRRCKSARLSKS